MSAASHLGWMGPWPVQFFLVGVGWGGASRRRIGRGPTLRGPLRASRAQLAKSAAALDALGGLRKLGRKLTDVPARGFSTTGLGGSLEPERREQIKISGAATLIGKRSAQRSGGERDWSVNGRAVSAYSALARSDWSLRKSGRAYAVSAMMPGYCSGKPGP
ncbi:hypothetical protein AYM39_21365 [Methylomonas sp. DH-1]|nr:hypothetical protein AYM39_21365 [Methylomonas sp. DH-1]